jgi:spermidine/putrescine transport system ATP-binding protein
MGGGITIENVEKSFAKADVRALAGVSLSVADGEFFTLLGPSGCGKTTLLRIIAGFERPDSGRLILDGKDIKDAPPDRRPVNTVFQNYALFPHLTVAENIAFGLQMRRVSKAGISAAVSEMLALVKLEGLGARRPAQLSGGQQQRVALARALANRPQVLLLDEPLSALDFKLRKAMQVELKRLQRETGVTFVFVTHDQEEALAMSDKIAVMANGEIRQSGAPAEIYERPANRFVADFIGEANIFTAHIRRTASGVCFDLGGGAHIPIAAEKAPAGDSCLLAIRPERVKLTSGTQSGKISAQVAEAIYQGDSTRCLLRAAGGLEIAAIVPGFNAPSRGDAVGVVLPPEALRVLADG